MDTFNILITEFPKKTARRTLMASRAMMRYTGYIITGGNTDAMKRSTDYNTVNGITRVISQDIFKDRFMQVICLSLNSDTKDFLGITVNSLENTMYEIDQRYMRIPGVLIINIIPWQLYYSKETMYESKQGDDAATLFRRYGYIEVSGYYNNEIIKTTVPQYVMVKFNNLGSIPFTLNGEYW